MRDMTGPCLVFEPNTRRKAAILRVLDRAGLSGIIDNSTADSVTETLARSLPLQLAAVAITDPAEETLGLLSRLRVACPGCLILAIDAVDNDDSVARCFSAGAHDVLRLPFRAPEFEARLAQGLTRMAPQKAKGAEAAHEMITRLGLTQAEARVLRVLAARQGQIVTRDELSMHLYGTPWTYGDRRFDVHVTRIRQKLKRANDSLFAIRTIRSSGYTLDYAGSAGA